MNNYDTLKEKQLDDEINKHNEEATKAKSKAFKNLSVELSADGTAKVVVNNMEAYDALLAISAIIRTLSDSVNVPTSHILKDLKGLTKKKAK